MQTEGRKLQCWLKDKKLQRWKKTEGLRFGKGERAVSTSESNVGLKDKNLQQWKKTERLRFSTGFEPCPRSVKASIRTTIRYLDVCCGGCYCLLMQQ
jgi:hypothetical protein